MGRAPDCEVAIADSRVSRKHCMIRVDGDRVLIRDLSSRNQTFVNKKALTAEVDYQLFHHSIIQVGKHAFRTSIRDAESGKPVSELEPADGRTPAPPDTETIHGSDLLNELDRLASELHVPQTVADHPANMSTISDELPIGDNEDTPETIEPVGQAAAMQTDTPHQLPGAKLDSKSEPDSKSKPEPDLHSTGHTKLPEHLRPKGPKDSQAAAENALRNLFK
ncbi:FHA domain-containing protein [Stieleria varia]|uniref:FHA domain-containing protein n=1 Tax=Stieleria varia TaxID=2528005 RepID=UPI001E303B2D|nr:FHA domain-containing protein [Stieleria varia]